MPPKSEALTETSILGGQINLNRREAGAVSLVGHLRSVIKKEPNTAGFFMCLSEPPINAKTNEIIGLPTRNLFYDRSVKPRSAIYASENLDLWPVTEFTTGDISTVILKTQDQEEIYISSVYLDITLPEVWPKILSKLLSHCKKRNKEVIICAD